jgi:membrane protein involved in colicin uptake
MSPSLPTRKMSAEEKRWRAEEDARTLAEAEVIKKDSARLKAAQQAAAKMAKEAADRAAGMSKIASKKGAFRPTRNYRR